jgi:hypothetical protein
MGASQPMFRVHGSIARGHSYAGDMSKDPQATSSVTAHHSWVILIERRRAEDLLSWF